MSIEKTLSIIKPDGVARQLIGQIYVRFEQAQLKIIAAKMVHLTVEQAQAFYDVHKDRPFFTSLVNFISSGPIMVQVLEGKNVIQRYRQLMGATDPFQANVGTLRADFASSIDENTVHGSDSYETANSEIAFFFASEKALLHNL